MQISLVVPNRNNLKYFKWMYDSVRKWQGNHDVYICSAADDCTDGTVEYYKELAERDKYFKYIVNDSGKRLGHTILYDRIIDELVETELAMIWHCDMYLCPGALNAIEKYMYQQIENTGMFSPFIPLIVTRPDGTSKFAKNKKRIVSLTRIEPPLHPNGPEKVLADFGTEPEDFREDDFIEWFDNTGFEVYIEEEKLLGNGVPTSQRYTNGIFAPWCFWVDEFKEIGGHDPLFAPQSAEDSDIFNRFKLNGVEFIQTWDGFVYHMTCRGNRRNTHDGAPNIHTNNPEWEKQNEISRRNFARKWHQNTLHDKWMNPIILNVYDIGFVVHNCTYELLHFLEPWCDTVYIDTTKINVKFYIRSEQPNSLFDIECKIRPLKDSELDVNDILIEFDGNSFMRNATYYMNFIVGDFSKMIDEVEPGEYEFDIFKVNVKRKEPYQSALIKCVKYKK